MLPSPHPRGGAIISTDGQLLENLPAGIGYRVSADASGLFVNGQPLPTAVWLQPDNGYVAVGDRWYRGRLLLLWQDGGVMTVNYVLLQDYLYSVVGAEMSASWSLEALKAQAVAARSYALVHSVRHQRRAYDLDDTQRYQAYKGVATEASSTHQAVHDTAGEFISYDGGVVESLYAANQDIVNDAHSGYGMSQTGALDLAQQGYRYYEILATYYPDTSVGRIDIGD
ncbi:MAG: SpoIID/LytB domain-containing protein [Cyanobacteria bacterium P01_D01_bin.2]